MRLILFSLAMLFIFIAPHARAAGSPCRAGAKATVEGTVNKIYWGKDKTWLYIDDPAWACAPIHIVVKGADVCQVSDHVRVSGVLLENDPRNLSYFQADGWSLSDAQLASGKGVPYATSYSCVSDPAQPEVLKNTPATVAKHKK
jgi:hypothetical protein